MAVFYGTPTLFRNNPQLINKSSDDYYNLLDKYIEMRLPTLLTYGSISHLEKIRNKHREILFNKLLMHDSIEYTKLTKFIRDVENKNGLNQIDFNKLDDTIFTKHFLSNFSLNIDLIETCIDNNENLEITDAWEYYRWIYSDTMWVNPIAYDYIEIDYNFPTTTTSCF